MVAYSFQSRFAEKIIAGEKRQTIRANRKRHARPGEALQLYTGMRTKHCRKILPVDPVCLCVKPIWMRFNREGASPPSATIAVGGHDIDCLEEMDLFAERDGFLDVIDMADFWLATHGHGAKRIEFEGVLIKWRLSAEN